MPNTVFGVETSFGIHVPDSPALIDSGSDVDISTEEVIHDPSNSVKKKGRGKALKWEKHLVEDKTGSILHQSLGDVVHDAAILDYSKVSSVDLQIKFKCKFTGCSFVRRYEMGSSIGQFISYFHGAHDHTDLNALTPEAHSGLTGEQKLLVHEVIDQEKMSSRMVCLRKCLFFVLREHHLVDPDTVKLNNYIQAHKRKNSSIYNPSPNDLKL